MGFQQEPRPHAAAGDSPLSSAQLKVLATAMTRAGKIHRAARLAAFTGWTLLAFGVLSCLLSFFSPQGILVGCALLAVGWNELEGRKMVLGFDPAGPRRIANNQLWFLVVIVLYCLWSIYEARVHPAPGVAQVEELVGIGPGFVANAMSAFYGLVLAVGVAYQLVMCRFHTARIRMVEAYVAETPLWVAEAQRVLRGEGNAGGVTFPAGLRGQTGRG